MNDPLNNTISDPYRFVPIKRQEEGASPDSEAESGVDRLLTCPRCGRKFRKSQTQAMPFCSKRCLQSDLNRWLSEEYTVETLNPQFDDSEE